MIDSKINNTVEGGDLVSGAIRGEKTWRGPQRHTLPQYDAAVTKTSGTRPTPWWGGRERVQVGRSVLSQKGNSSQEGTNVSERRGGYHATRGVAGAPGDVHRRRGQRAALCSPEG